MVRRNKDAEKYASYFCLRLHIILHIALTFLRIVNMELFVIINLKCPWF